MQHTFSMGSLNYQKLTHWEEFCVFFGQPCFDNPGSQTCARVRHGFRGMISNRKFGKQGEAVSRES
jgi:hypothetical protein